MKRMILFLLLFSLSLSGCAALRTIDAYAQPDEEIANARMEAFLSAVADRDSQALRELFAPNALAEMEDFDAMAAALFDYCSGKFTAYDDWAGPDSSKTMHYGDVVKTLHATYDIQMEEGNFRIALSLVRTDNTNPDNVGLWSVYIIRAEDDTDLQYAYRGDGEYTPGIHIGIPNTLPVTITE